ncbi:unnamed protein product [Blumeria hordei]|uniref:Uncharacterized protein n=1 Tax=Blumeria hordei TaxID=2867405 RepID=A0A383UPA5_BLUHO|nr:unnamed protein product [Blumeria hordei]
MQTTNFITASAVLLFLPAAFCDKGTVYKCTGATFSPQRELKDAQQACFKNLNNRVQVQNGVKDSRKDSEYRVVLTPQKRLPSPIRQEDRLEYIAEYRGSTCELIHVFEVKKGLSKYCFKTSDQFSREKKQENLKTHEANRRQLIPCGNYMMEVSYLIRAATSGCKAFQEMQKGHHEPHIKALSMTKFPQSTKFYRPGTLYEWPFHPDGQLQKLGKNPGIYRIIIDSKCKIVGFHVLEHMDGTIKRGNLYCALNIPHGDSDIGQRHTGR